MSKTKEHVVYCGSYRLNGGEWLYYFCYTCGETDTTIYASRHPTNEEWGAVVGGFDAAHPHSEVRDVPCM